MAVDLNQEVCAQCGTRLTDRNSVVENEGTLYCCNNCFVHATRSSSAAALPATEYCAHCGLSIVDASTRVQQGASVYCCNNCANARERNVVGRPA